MTSNRATIKTPSGPSIEESKHACMPHARDGNGVGWAGLGQKWAVAKGLQAVPAAMGSVPCLLLREATCFGLGMQMTLCSPSPFAVCIPALLLSSNLAPSGIMSLSACTHQKCFTLRHGRSLQCHCRATRRP